jgi:hypothetical protein
MSQATINPPKSDFAPGATVLPAEQELSGSLRQRIAQRLERLEGLKAGWDGEDARALDARALATAAAILSQTISAGLPEPELFPVPDGGIQIEWRAGRVEMEVEIEPEQGGVVFVCDDEQTGQQIDGQLPGDESRLWLALERLLAHSHAGSEA